MALFKDYVQRPYYMYLQFYLFISSFDNNSCGQQKTK